MDGREQDAVKTAMDAIPSALTLPNTQGLPESIVTDAGIQNWGAFFRVPIDESVSIGKVYGIAPTWLTVLEVSDDGWANISVDYEYVESELR